MSRDLVIPGEALVRVKGMGALALEDGGAGLHELGLAVEDVRIVPRFYHHEMRIDDYGPNVPAELLWMLADCTIEMVLIHFDRAVLSACLVNSMGAPAGNVEGRMAAAGTMMGGGKPLRQPGNRYISLTIASPQDDYPWRFPAAYLATPPVEYPLGTKAAAVACSWRAIPYAVTDLEQTAELVSENVQLWDHEEDV